MRALAWVIVAALATGCVLLPPAPEPAPENPLTENPETLPPRTRPVTPAPTPPGTGPTPVTPTPPSSPPPQEPPPETAPTPPTPDEAAPPAEEAPPPLVVWPRRDRDDPPRDVGFAPGLDEPDGTFILSWEQADDGLGFDAALASFADTRIHIDSLARVASSASQTRGIRLSADAITDPFVSEAVLALWDANGAQVAAIDLLDASPSVETTIPAGAVYDLSWTLTLVEGATDDVAVSVRLGVAA